LPGRTQQEAFDAFIEPLKKALSCVAYAKITRTKLNSELDQSIIVQPSPLPFTDSPYQLFMTHTFRYVRHNGTEWRVSSLRYEYAIEVSKKKHEVVAFHWEGHNSGAAPFAHLHLGHANVSSAPLLGPKAHIPTGRVAIEDVVYFLIEDLGVKPLKPDWKEVLARVRQQFMNYKSW
jgi:hypothetical protein